MRRFLSGNVGNATEIIFSVLGLRERVTGKIAEVTENAVVLDVNGDLTAGAIDNILFIRVFKNPEHAKDAVLESETQNRAPGFPNTNKSGRNFNPSLNTPGRRTQTILR